MILFKMIKVVALDIWNAITVFIEDLSKERVGIIIVCMVWAFFSCCAFKAIGPMAYGGIFARTIQAMVFGFLVAFAFFHIYHYFRSIYRRARG